jgi:oligopeptide/dipeptide ABC transporter ATP-binding protein
MSSTITGEPVLSVEGLAVSARSAGGVQPILHQVDLQLDRSEIVGIVGESGSGKSTLCRAIARTLPKGVQVESGSIRLGDTDLLQCSTTSVHRIKPGGIRMVFQHPQAALNPVMSIGAQVIEALRASKDLSRRDARSEAVVLLEEMGIRRAAERLADYPYQFSGGQRQRIVIAIALAGDPAVLLADEPTSALDVTTQAQILDMFEKIATEYGTAIVLVTHNYGVVAQLCTRTIVLYGGHVVEAGGTDDLLHRSRHPYTTGLIASLPSPATRHGRLPSIPGDPPRAAPAGSGCPFSSRCEYSVSACSSAPVDLREVGPDHRSACIRVAEIWKADRPGETAKGPRSSDQVERE